MIVLVHPYSIVSQNCISIWRYFLTTVTIDCFLLFKYPSTKLNFSSFIPWQKCMVNTKLICMVFKSVQYLSNGFVIHLKFTSNISFWILRVGLSYYLCFRFFRWTLDTPYHRLTNTGNSLTTNSVTCFNTLPDAAKTTSGNRFKTKTCRYCSSW